MQPVTRLLTGACKLCNGRPLSNKASAPRVCIVGSGPAGFYVAQHLIKKNESVEVDIYERLPVPFGLVRYGVAPDHPEVKNVINTFTKTAHNSRVRFFGNVSLGGNLSLQELQRAYHAVVLTYGAEKDQELGVDGETLKGVVSARRLVGWYNGLPADSELEVPLDTDVAVVLGQGNVAVDVARMLLTHVDILKKQKAVSTDVREHLPCGLVLRSIGYRSVAADSDIPFDTARGVVLQKPGLYAAGWLATGPVGVILSTMSNAFETANTILQDLSVGTVDTSQPRPGAEYILSLLRAKGVPTVDFKGWERIDQAEVERGKAVGKPREKIINVAEMLEIGGSVR